MSWQPSLAALAPKNLLLLIVAAVMAGVIGKYFLSLDEDIGNIENYVMRSSYVLNKVGSIESVSLKKRIKFYGTQNEQPYVQCTYLIIGQKDKLLINVRIYPEEKGNIEKYKLFSVNNQFIQN